MPGRIFISYAKENPEATKDIAAFLRAEGYTVWWDTNLRAGEVFREVIDRELDAADAVVVIWTPHSVSSNWVISEADHGNRKHKLITLRTKDIEPWRIPKPYDTYHTNLVDDHPGLLAAVQRLAGTPAKAPPPPPPPGLSEHTVQEALALEYWQAVKTSTDPHKVRAFIADYGTTGCAALARDLLKRLEDGAWSRLPRRRSAAILEGFLAQSWDGDKAALARAELAALRNVRASGWSAGAARNETSPPPRPAQAPPPLASVGAATPLWTNAAVILPGAALVLLVGLYATGIWPFGQTSGYNPSPILAISVLFGLALWHYGRVGVLLSLAAAVLVFATLTGLNFALGSINLLVTQNFDPSVRKWLFVFTGYALSAANAAAIMAIGAAFCPVFRNGSYWAIALLVWPTISIAASLIGSVAFSTGMDRNVLIAFYLSVYILRQIVTFACIGFWLSYTPSARAA